MKGLVFSRRQSLAAIVSCAAAWSSSSAWAQRTPAKVLPMGDALQPALQAALAQQQPLMVMVSLAGCPFCKVARQNYLLPLLNEGQPIVQVDMRSTRALTDLSGRATTHDAQVRAWGISIAPTLLFLGAGGQEVADRLVGATSLDFYGGYLDDRVAAARAAVKK